MNALTDGSGARGLAAKVLRRLPGAGFAQEQIDRVERRLLHELKQRLDRLEPPTSVSVLAVAMRSVADRSGAAASFAIGSRMHQLLQASTEHSREDAEQAFFQWVMSNLVPDQARILSALSDGSTYPLIHIYAGPRLGIAVEPVLECVCSVGKNAGVLWPETTHVYVQQLRGYGLVETGPEEPARKVQYEMLETEQSVRDVLARLQKGGLRAQVVRRVLMMSDLGNRLWAACRVGTD
ncbi:MAG TPA: Abi-alpha family protein [Solimonas sp.]|nr:Abi-alpha family protein [Solimonas sp.]